MIIFMGDSITRDWPVAEVAGCAVNAGVAGETTGQMRLRFEREVVARRPRVVHLLGGINDIAENQGPVPIEEIAANLDAMVVAAAAAGIGVVLGLVLPCTRVRKRPHLRPGPAVLRLNALLSATPRGAGVVLADHFTPLVEGADRLRADCTSDGLHPEAPGYALMTPVVRAALLRLDPVGFGPQAPGAECASAVRA